MIQLRTEGERPLERPTSQRLQPFGGLRLTPWRRWAVQMECLHPRMATPADSARGSPGGMASRMCCWECVCPREPPKNQNLLLVVWCCWNLLLALAQEIKKAAVLVPRFPEFVAIFLSQWFLDLLLRPQLRKKKLNCWTGLQMLVTWLHSNINSPGKW